MGLSIMPLHIGEFLADTANMSPAEVGAYIRLIIFSWSNDGELPLDLTQQCRIAGAFDPHERITVSTIVNRFWQLVPNQQAYTHKPLTKQLERRSERSKSGKTGAVNRWKKDENAAAHDGKAYGKTIATAMAVAMQNDMTKSIAKPMATAINPRARIQNQVTPLASVIVSKEVLSSVSDLPLSLSKPVSKNSESIPTPPTPTPTTAKSQEEKQPLTTQLAAPLIGKLQPGLSIGSAIDQALTSVCKVPNVESEEFRGNGRDPLDGVGRGVSLSSQDAITPTIKEQNHTSEPYVRWDGKQVTVSDDLGLRWQAAFPDLAVGAELDYAAVWLEAHPDQVPRPDDLHGWMAAWLLRSEARRKH